MINFISLFQGGYQQEWQHPKVAKHKIYYEKDKRTKWVVEQIISYQHKEKKESEHANTKNHET